MTFTLEWTPTGTGRLRAEVIDPSITPEQIVALLNDGKAWLQTGVEGSRDEGERWIGTGVRRLAVVVDNHDDKMIFTDYRIVTS